MVCNNQITHRHLPKFDSFSGQHPTTTTTVVLTTSTPPYRCRWRRSRQGGDRVATCSAYDPTMIGIRPDVLKLTEGVEELCGNNIEMFRTWIQLIDAEEVLCGGNTYSICRLQEYCRTTTTSTTTTTTTRPPERQRILAQRPTTRPPERRRIRPTTRPPERRSLLVATTRAAK